MAIHHLFSHAPAKAGKVLYSPAKHQNYSVTFQNDVI